MRCSFLFLFHVAASLFAQQSPVPETRYRSVPDFFKLPVDLYIGEVAGVAVNSKGHIFVFSRGNTTGQAYGASAAQLLEFGADGKFAREIGPPNQVMCSSDAYPGRIYKLSLDGRVLGMLGKSGKQLGEFGWIHEIACPSENELYVAEILNWGAQKLILEPTH